VVTFSLRVFGFAPRHLNRSVASRQLADLLAIVEHNDEVVIAQNGQPIARLTSVALMKKKRIAGLNRGMIWTSEDFDAPLPDEFWLGKE
jgi:prevent-host-death family protein